MLDEFSSKNHVGPPGFWMFCDFEVPDLLVDQRNKKWGFICQMFPVSLTLFG